MNTVVVGSLNTDLVATGIVHFPGPGGYAIGTELKIGPGGKSRNIAAMMASICAPDSVAMVARTVHDPYGLWRLPMDALTDAGVNTDYVNVLEYAQSKKLPGIALIPVDTNGTNQIFVLPGVSADFSPTDIVLKTCSSCIYRRIIARLNVANNYMVDLHISKWKLIWEDLSHLAEVFRSFPVELHAQRV